MELAVAGLFLDGRSAEEAVRSLVEHGYAPDRISVVAKADPESSSEEISEVEENPPGEETLRGTMTGGVLGGILGLAVGVTAVALPGAVIAVGPIAGLIGGAALGATAGAIVGSLRELGLTEDEVHGYMTSIEAGAVLVAVHAQKHSVHRAERILTDAGARDVHVVYPES